jgi:hypothetical protein
MTGKITVFPPSTNGTTVVLWTSTSMPQMLGAILVFSNLPNKSRAACSIES